jgi:hypothetical protein
MELLLIQEIFWNRPRFSIITLTSTLIVKMPKIALDAPSDTAPDASSETVPDASSETALDAPSKLVHTSIAALIF